MISSSNTPEPSLGKRYLFKLCSNIATIPLFFLQEAILPRILGPIAYGNFTFVAAFYTQIINFLDLGTGVCLRTGLAKRPHETGIISFYLRITLYIFSALLLCGIIMYAPSVSELFLPNIPLWMIFPSLFCAFLTWLSLTTRGMNDAIGSTTSSELIRIVISISSAMVLLVLFFSHILSLPLFYLQQGVTYGAITIGVVYTFIRAWKKRNPSTKAASFYELTTEQRTSYIREYKSYCSPLFVIALCSMLALLFERWVLQFFSGSLDQGYFSLSQKVGMACFLFVTAMMPLLQRDLSMAHGKQDFEAMAKIIDRFAPLLYSIAGWFACFTCIEASGVIHIFAGNDFLDAMLPVQIMAFYPVHQCYGQLASTIFYASGNTSTLRNFTLLGLMAGIICTWIFVAPLEFGGLHLGATGLALKMVLIQMITVNILMWRCSKDIAFSFKKNFLHQILSPLCFLLLAFVSQQLTMQLSFFTPDSLLRFFLSGSVYALLSSIVVYAIPSTIGMKPNDIRGLIVRGKGWILARKARI